MNSVITKKRISVLVFFLVCFLIINAFLKDGMKNFIYEKSSALQASLWDRGSADSFARKNQEDLNKKLIEENLVDAVIGLPPGLFFGAAIQTCIMILKRDKKGDSIYLFSDGYADQFGGAKGKKFMYKQFKEILLANSQKPMPEQKEVLDKTINEWIGNGEQVDDITILGLKL